MSSSEPGERAQCSVAELLARYGETAPATGRRRRRTPDDGDTTPHSIIQRVQTDSGPLPVVGRAHRRRAAESDLEGPQTGPNHRVPEPPTWDDRGRSALPGRSWGTLDGHLPGSGALDDRKWADLKEQTGLNGTGLGTTGLAGAGLHGHGSPRGVTDLDSAGPDGYRTSFGIDDNSWMDLPPPVSAGPTPFTDLGLSGGAPTDKLPRLAPELWPPDPLARSESRPSNLLSEPGPPDLLPSDPRTSQARPNEAEPSAGLTVGIPSVPRQGGSDGRVDEYPADPAEDFESDQQATELIDDTRHTYRDDTDRNPSGRGDTIRPVDEEYLVDDGPLDDREGQIEAGGAASPVREWAMMATQVCVGVVGGAVLWLIFEWLWQRIPVVALVVALVVITGLVWVVRRVRRAEDLQTTVIAVLVGLFVTVSPAALLLVGR